MGMSECLGSEYPDMSRGNVCQGWPRFAHGGEQTFFEGIQAALRKSHNCSQTRNTPSPQGLLRRMHNITRLPAMVRRQPGMSRPDPLNQPCSAYKTGDINP
jgi:hypothetical protein